MQERGLDDFTQLFNLLLAATHVAVCHIRLLFYLHHCDCGVDFGRQGNVNLVLVPVNAHSHALFNVCRCHRIGQVDDKLGKLFDIDDVFRIVRVGIDDLGTPGNLIVITGLLRDTTAQLDLKLPEVVVH